jgi:hypothetical protein
MWNVEFSYCETGDSMFPSRLPTVSSFVAVDLAFLATGYSDTPEEPITMLAVAVAWKTP